MIKDKLSNFRCFINPGRNHRRSADTDSGTMHPSSKKLFEPLSGAGGVSNGVMIRPDFHKAFEFLSRKDLSNIPDGKYEINGKKLFAVLSHSHGKGVKKALLETHRKYIDIQFVIEGRDLIGIAKTGECKSRVGGYDPENDIMFFNDKPGKYIKLKPGEFAVFFPDDAHAPLSGAGTVRKAVVKVAVQ